MDWGKWIKDAVGELDQKGCSKKTDRSLTPPCLKGACEWISGCVQNSLSSNCDSILLHWDLVFQGGTGFVFLCISLVWRLWAAQGQNAAGPTAAEKGGRYNTRHKTRGTYNTWDWNTQATRCISLEIQYTAAALLEELAVGSTGSSGWLEWKLNCTVWFRCEFHYFSYSDVTGWIGDCSLVKNLCSNHRWPKIALVVFGTSSGLQKIWQLQWVARSTCG